MNTFEIAFLGIYSVGISHLNCPSLEKFEIIQFMLKSAANRGLLFFWRVSDMLDTAYSYL